MSLSSPFGERTRKRRDENRLVSRGVVVESGPQHRARQQVRALEQLSRAVVEGLEEGVVVTDGDLRAVSWNRSALSILGLDAETIRGRAAPFASDLQGDDTLRRRGRRWITVTCQPISSVPGAGMVYTFADVTARVQQERNLRDERDRAQRYLEVASALVVVLDDQGRIELVNRQGCEILGFEEAEIIGRDWFSLVVPAEDRLDARMAFNRLASGVEPPKESLETAIRTRAGEDRKIAWRNSVLRDRTGAIVSVVRAGEDVTERRAAEAQVAYLAYHDGLTGLANRTRLEEQLEHDMARGRRTGRALALLYFDLDDFKLVNDSLGHSVGDEVLKETARRVAALTRAGDLLCRQGGDEFLLLLNCDEAEDADHAARQAGERVRAALERPFLVGDAEFHVGASIGAALFPEHAQDTESLFKRADAAMYQAKRMGRGTVAIYEEETGDDSRRRLSLTSELRRAVAEGELCLHYQPIHRLPTNEITALEALVRWQHPVDGLVPPGMFIPLAEQTGLIDAISEWVVASLCRQAARWATAGRYPMLSFNLSPRQAGRADLVASITHRIDAHGLARSQFCAELTESAVLSDERRQGALIEELREAGIAVAIDDFGAGHSSLSRLRDLPVQILKVDRSFLGAVPEDGRSCSIVAAILELGTALGMTTVVEGVETQGQLDFLVAHGCPRAQGYLLGRPVPASAIPVAALPRLAGVPA